MQTCSSEKVLNCLLQCLRVCHELTLAKPLGLVKDIITLFKNRLAKWTDSKELSGQNLDPKELSSTKIGWHAPGCRIHDGTNRDRKARLDVTPALCGKVKERWKSVSPGSVMAQPSRAATSRSLRFPDSR